jgi:hypothetical protein
MGTPKPDCDVARRKPETGSSLAADFVHYESGEVKVQH